MEGKWSCPSCTYANWSASRFCAMCMFSKKNEEDGPTGCRSRHEGEDSVAVSRECGSPLIINMSSSQTATSPSRARKAKKGFASAADNSRQSGLAVSSGHGGDGGRSPPGQKWSCLGCGWSNGLNANLCTKCCAYRPKKLTLSPTNTRGDVHSLSASGPSLPGGRSSPPCDSLRSSASRQRKSKRAHNRDNMQKSAAGSGGAAEVRKWSCPACTYDNWPRNVRCAMCGKSRSLPAQSPTDSSSGESDGCAGSADDHTASRSAAVFPSAESPATACANTNSQVDLDKQLAILADSVEQIRNRLAPLDVLFIGACTGVVDNDVHAVEAYLAAGGDRSRQLTGDEVLLLSTRPRPVIASAGQTLVHIALG